MFDPATLSPDDRRHFYRRTAIPALCLLLVAGLHAFRVVAYDQTRWKGGGFGMFSTVDAETARFVKVFLTFDELPGEAIPIQVPESLSKREATLRALPDKQLAEELAAKIGTMHFAPRETTLSK